MSIRDTGNLYRSIAAPMPAEISEQLLNASHFRVERIVSHGHCSAVDFWYDQPEHEWVLLVHGEAVLTFQQDNRTIRLTAGDYLHIPAHQKHRVEWTKENEDTVWLAIFYRTDEPLSFPESGTRE